VFPSLRVASDNLSHAVDQGRRQLLRTTVLRTTVLRTNVLRTNVLRTNAKRIKGSEGCLIPGDRSRNERCNMSKFVFGMMQSLDGYIAGKGQTFSAVTGSSGDPILPPPGPELSRHFSDQVRGVAGILYGRTMYEIMRYWDEDDADWEEEEHDFAAAWRSKPKWVVSRSLKTVGPNATLASGDLETFARRLKADVEGEIDVAGAQLAASLSALGLIDEYRLYLRPFVLGGGKPFFAAARPPLRLVKTDRVGEEAVRLIYVPA
jgi:dihydrofolate reductase